VVNTHGVISSAGKHRLTGNVAEAGSAVAL